MDTQLSSEDGKSQSVSNGCWNCPSWDQVSLAVGRCWSARNRDRFGCLHGALTCSSHICPGHPKFTPPAFERGAS